MRLYSDILPGDAGTLGATVPWMRRLVQEGRAHPLVQAQARTVISATPHLHPVESLFRYVQGLPYRYDEDIVKEAGFSDDTSEMLQGAPLQVEKSLLDPRTAQGDCDDRAILLQSLLESQGVPTRFVLVRGPGRHDYSHVYSEAALGGEWVPLDTIMDGKDGRPFFGPGEEVGEPKARDRTSVPVDGGGGEGGGGLGGTALLVAALLLLYWRLR